MGLFLNSELTFGIKYKGLGVRVYKVIICIHVTYNNTELVEGVGYEVKNGDVSSIGRKLNPF